MMDVRDEDTCRQPFTQVRRTKHVVMSKHFNMRVANPCLILTLYAQQQLIVFISGDGAYDILCLVNTNNLT
jgi:hypothetical protein